MYHDFQNINSALRVKMNQRRPRVGGVLQEVEKVKANQPLVKEEKIALDQFQDCTECQVIEQSLT